MRTRRFRMRMLVMIVLLLIGGAIINVAVAWSIAIFSAKPDLQYQEVKQRSGEDNENDEYSYWLIQERAALGSLLIRSSWYDTGMSGGIGFGLATETPQSLVATWAPQLSPAFESSEFTYHEVIARAYGWPFPSLGGVLVFEQIGAERTERLERYFAIPLGDGASTPTPDHWDDNPRKSHWDQRLLPLRPLWPGFVINTILHTIILLLLFVAPFTLLRVGRTKRGLCPKCAYPIGPSDTCTECGKLLRKVQR